MRASMVNLGCFLEICVLLMAGASTPWYPEEEDFVDASDIVAWSEGDWFHYDATVNMVSPDLTYDGSGYLTMSVSAIETKVVSGVSYDIYNITLDGDIPGAGYIVYEGFTIDYEFDTMLIDGYLLMERGDLALVKADIAIDADGRARVLFAWNPLRIDATLAGNANPPAELFDFPLFVGDEWLLTSSIVLTGSVHIVLESVLLPIDITEPIDLPLQFETDMMCDEKSPVTTPAGTFDSYRIASADGTTSLRYAPDVGGFATVDMSYSDASTTMEVHLSLNSFFRAPSPISVEEVLIPSIVNVGGPVVVQGRISEPNANVRIWIPASGQEWFTATDDSGYYNLAISSPTTPDNTPTSYDYGSHGVIVEVSSGSSASTNVSSLTLVLPDLHFPSPSLDVDDILIENTLVPITAMFVTTEDVHNPFDVTFYVDDIPQQSKSLGGMKANSPQEFQVDWLSVLGNHEIKFIVDSNDDVMEENELNNTASKVVSVYPYAYPDPPDLLSGDLSGPMFSDVGIDWIPPNDNGVPIDHYEVLRSSSYDPSGAGYEFVASVSPAESQFIDHRSSEGDPNNYFYVVCARNVINLSSCSSTQAGKFTRQLTNGSQLVSIPLIQSNESIEIVLQTVNFDRALTYDSLSGMWMSYMKSKPYYGELLRLDHTIGLWLNVTEESNLTIAGIVPAQTEIHLRAGWNLVGLPSFNSTYTVSDLSVTMGLTRAEGFDPFEPPHYLRVLEKTEGLQAGHGYWVRVVEDVVWIVGTQ